MKSQSPLIGSVIQTQSIVDDIAAIPKSQSPLIGSVIQTDSRVDAITVGEASQSPLIGSVIQTERRAWRYPVNQQSQSPLIGSVIQTKTRLIFSANVISRNPLWSGQLFKPKTIWSKKRTPSFVAIPSDRVSYSNKTETKEVENDQKVAIPSDRVSYSNGILTNMELGRPVSRNPLWSGQLFKRFSMLELWWCDSLSQSPLIGSVIQTSCSLCFSGVTLVAIPSDRVSYSNKSWPAPLLSGA